MSYSARASTFVPFPIRRPAYSRDAQNRGCAALSWADNRSTFGRPPVDGSGEREMRRAVEMVPVDTGAFPFVRAIFVSSRPRANRDEKHP